LEGSGKGRPILQIEVNPSVFSFMEDFRRGDFQGHRVADHFRRIAGFSEIPGHSKVGHGQTG